MKEKILSLLIVVASANFSFSQKIYEPDDVYTIRKLTFYGYDYSHFILADVKRMDEDIRKFVFNWIGFCQDRISEKTLAKWLSKDTAVFNLEPTVALNKKLKSEDLGGVSMHTIPEDSIQSFVNKYVIAEKQGIGLVIVVECFNNDKKTVSAYFTFFDIASRKILNSEYVVSRDGNSYNRVSDWGTALVIAIKKYQGIYQDRLKAAQRAMR